MTDAPSPVDLAPSWEAMVRGMDARLAAARARRDGAAGEPAVGVGVVLVGPMGAGKTTVGRLVAERLSLAFIDADDLFVRAHGPIPAFFAEHGEPAFRREEERVVAHVLEQSEPCVLACGGGAVLSAATRRRLTASPALVVSLTVAEEEALRRVGGGAGRPVLAGDPAGTWRRILAERAPLYRAVAGAEVDGTGRPPSEAASRIVDLMIPPTPRSRTRP